MIANERRYRLPENHYPLEDHHLLESNHLVEKHLPECEAVEEAAKKADWCLWKRGCAASAAYLPESHHLPADRLAGCNLLVDEGAKEIDWGS